MNKQQENKQTSKQGCGARFRSRFNRWIKVKPTVKIVGTIKNVSKYNKAFLVIDDEPTLDRLEKLDDLMIEKAPDGKLGRPVMMINDESIHLKVTIPKKIEKKTLEAYIDKPIEFNASYEFYDSEKYGRGYYLSFFGEITPVV